MAEDIKKLKRIIMNKKPTVSAIIPTYNRAHLIGRAIQSVLKQTYKDFELIIVDDGSTDNTEDIIKEFQKKDERIKYICHDKNKGGSAARNTGIKAARGEYIAFQDSDDEWLPEKLKKQMEIFKDVSVEVGIVYTDMWRITGNKKSYFYSPKIMPKDKIIYKQALDYGVSNIGIQTSLIKKEVFAKAGMFDEKLPRYIDLEFFIRLSKYYYFYHINEPLVNYFDTEICISSNAKALIGAQKLILKKYFKDVRKNKKLLAKHYLGIGTSLCINEEIKEGEIYFAKAFEIYPNIKKDKRLLSRYYFNIGVSLCSSNDFFIEGRNYMVKAVKTQSFNIKFLTALLVSSFGQSVYGIAVRIYRKTKEQI